MRGIQGPGGSRSRDRTRRAYAVRGVLAILILLLLLALIIPRACQALIGSDEGTGSGGDRGATAPEKAAGAAGGADGDEGTTAERADAADGDATDKTSGAGDGEARKVKGTRAQDDEKDLGAILTETLAEGAAEPQGTGTDQGAVLGDAASVDQPAPPAQQASADEGAGSPSTTPPVEKPPLAPAPEPGVGSETGPVASSPASRRVAKPKPAPGPVEPPAVQAASVPKPNLDQVQVSPPKPGPIDVATVRVAPVAAAPVRPAPVVVNDTAFARGGASMATNFGGGAVGVPVNNTAAFTGAVRGATAVAGAGP